MSKMKLGMVLGSLVVGGVALSAAPARASITVSWIPEGTPTSTSTGPLTGWEGYVLRLTSSNSNIASVDFGGANTGKISGPLAQRWTASNSDGVYDTPTPGFNNSNNTTNSANNVDTHFLGTAANLVVGHALTEDATFPNGNPLTSTPDVGFGVGTFLSGAYGVNVGQSTTLDVAYVVVQDGKTISFTNAQAATNSDGTFTISGSVTGTPVPEPASLSLLGLGSLGLMARRRKLA